MSTTLSCALLGSGQQLVACAERWLARGHRIVGVVSNCPEVSSWADARGVARCTPDDQLRFLAREPFDYLFSIVNHSIAPAELLALPRRLAINYHDSPLPRYAGFNATAWAILDGQSAHAVTWHEMTASVDAGRILLQAPIEIREDDTAFTLGAKCAEAGVTSFEELTQRLELAQQDHLSLLAPPQGASGDFHFRSDRPDLALLDFQRPARVLHALVRGLNFGPDDSWMCKPKLRCPGGLLVVSEAAVGNASPEAAEPGRVLSVDESGLEIATAEGTLRVSELCTLEGAQVQLAELTRYGLVAGDTLQPAPRSWTDAAQQLDRTLTKHERFWVERLRDARPPQLPELTFGRQPPEPAMLRVDSPAALHSLPAAERANALLAALVAYLA
ncbi:MAG TPA: formyltransferase family protein, partial [Polyangiales bacterium]